MTVQRARGNKVSDMQSIPIYFLYMGGDASSLTWRENWIAGAKTAREIFYATGQWVGGANSSVCSFPRFRRESA